MNYQRINDTSCAIINDIPKELINDFAKYHIKDNIYEITDEEYKQTCKPLIRTQKEFEDNYNKFNLIIDTDIVINNKHLPKYDMFMSWKFTDNMMRITESVTNNGIIVIPKCKKELVLEDCKCCSVNFMDGAYCVFRNCRDMIITLDKNHNDKHVHLDNCVDCKIIFTGFAPSNKLNIFYSCENCVIQCNNCELNKNQILELEDSTCTIKYINTVVNSTIVSEY